MRRAARSDADGLADQDHSRPAGVPLAVEDQHLLEACHDAELLLHAVVLVWEDRLVDPAERLVEVGHDLLAADHEYDLAGTRGIRAELAAGGRSGDERAIDRHRGDAAELDVGCTDELADLATLRLPVHREHSRPDGVVATAAKLLDQPEVL